MRHEQWILKIIDRKQKTILSLNCEKCLNEQILKIKLKKAQYKTPIEFFKPEDLYLSTLTTMTCRGDLHGTFVL